MDVIPQGMKKCPYCAEFIKAEAIKCRYCKEMLGPRPSPEQLGDAGASASTDPLIEIAPGARGGGKPEQEGELLYIGGPSILCLFKVFVLAGLILSLGGFLAFFPESWLDSVADQALIQGFLLYRLWGFLILAGLVGMVVSFRVALLKSVKYAVTRDRIEFERGLFNKKSDTLEIFRIKDAALERPFKDRLLGLGTIHLATTDESHPAFILAKIRNSRMVFTDLKQLSLDADMDRRVIHTD